MNRRFLVGVLTTLLTPLFAVGAQEPVRLPGVVISAERTPPGPKLFVGVVKDTLALTLEGVEVSIPELKKRTLTKDDGTFRFDGVSRGKYSVRARKFGYAPQVREFTIGKDGGLGEFELMPLARALPPIVSSAARGGLSGTIADTSYAAVPGATVMIKSKALHIETDSLGAFFLPAPPGQYIVSIRKEGYTTKVATVTIPEDSGRHLAVALMPAVDVPVRERNNVADFEDRQTWRNKLFQPFFTHEDLQAMGIEWIHDVLNIGGGEQYDADCEVIVNGGPKSIDVSKLTIDDVEAVEVYGSRRFQPVAVGSMVVKSIGKAPTVRRSAPNNTARPLPITNANEAGWANVGKRCPIAYVWLR